MTLAYLTTPLLGLTDTAIIGQYGDAALLGGLAAGALVFDFVFSTFNFLRAGTTGLVAQAFGAGNIAEEQAIFWRAFFIALLLGIVIAISAPLIAMGGIRFLGAEAQVNQALDTYVRIRMLSAPFALVNYAILGYLLGRGDGKTALALQILLNGTNIGLSLLFGLYLGWNVAGVAWGTVGGELITMLAGLAIVLARFRHSPHINLAHIANIAAIRRMMVLNRDIMIRSFALLAAFALFTRQGAQFDTVTLAANAVLINFFLTVSFFLDGFAAAAEQLTGRAVGAQNRMAFRQAVKLCALWGFMLAGIATGTVLLWGNDLIAFLTTAEDVRELAADFLPWAALTALSAVLAFEMDGIFIGGTWSVDMRNAMLLSLATFIIAMVVLTPLFGNHGLWAALHLFLLMRGLSLLVLLPGRVRSTFSHPA
ncbi:MATE family efflux transporter [Aquamicrobium segne]|uniref:MATE family efflux transporter n=1 Tax=Aquamicrobium segne TaxID=469547 RepID=A0ABW0GW21_9HYPH